MVDFHSGIMSVHGTLTREHVQLLRRNCVVGLSVHTGEPLDVLSDCHFLRNLCVFWGRRGIKPIEALSNLHRLLVASYEGPKVDLSKLTDLRSLELDRARCFHGFRDNQKLTYVNFWGANEQTLQELVTCRCVNDLSLIRPKGRLDSLSNLQNLEFLWVAQAKELDDLSFARELPLLTTIRLEGCTAPLNIAPIVGIRNLQSVTLINVKEASNIGRLAEAQSLREVILAGNTPVNQAVVDALRQLPDHVDVQYRMARWHKFDRLRPCKVARPGIVMP